MPSIYGLPTIAEADSLSVVPAWSRDLARVIAANQAELLRATGKVPGLSPETAAGMLSRIATAESNISATTTALAPLRADTDWTNVTVDSGISVGEQVQYRVRGGIVYWRGLIYKNGGLPAGATTIVSAAAPAARPTGTQLRPTATNAAIHLYLQMGTGGKLEIWSSATTGGWIHLSPMSYLI